ncbi:peptidoglycan-binding domain-containing protein [Micromonospora purpureochromogenes]|uniref:peptidoglycan-binding domain-containing protein n=1 Tax=Micromonospora purpureochromogenes TaxID=47872 RepID=UPI003626703B
MLSRASRLFRLRLPSAVLAVALALGLAVAPGSAAQAALPTCNSFVYKDGYNAYGSVSVRVPVWREPYEPGYTLDCDLRSGNYNNTAVRILQETLNHCYWNIIGAQLTADGDFGTKTRDALIKVQRHHGILADGGYGPQTRKTVYHHGLATNEGAGTCGRLW